MNTSAKRVVPLTLLVWLCLGVGVAGLFRNVSALAVAATVWTLTAMALLACWKITAIRVWVLEVDLRWLVSIHLTRFVAGIYFLVLCRRGELPCAFATRAGWGDILVALLAMPVIAAVRGQSATKVVLVWNTIGFIDIVFVVFSALRFGLQDWQSMHALRQPPLSLLPTFLVPLIIASHVLIFVRIAQARKID